MKNKFLLMAVISALGALLVLPSALGVTTSQDTEVDVSISSGDFSLTVQGTMADDKSFGVRDIPASNLVVSTTVGFDHNDNSNHFQLKDYDTAIAGGKVTLRLIRNFVNDSISIDDFIPAANLQVFMQDNTTGQPKCVKSNTLVGSNACVIMMGSTSPLVSSSSNYAIGAGFTTGPWTGNMLGSDFLTMTVNNPYVLRFGFEKYRLTIPANITAGRYSSVLYLLASQ